MKPRKLVSDIEVPIHFRIEYEYLHDPGVRTFRNGDPGYPPSTECNAYKVFVVGKDGSKEVEYELIWPTSTGEQRDLFPESVWDMIIEELIEKAEEERNDS